MATTIHDVANYLGVSASTVSRCINDHPDISDEMKQRVRDAMERLNYVPSSAARNVSRKSTRTIGLTIPDIEDPYFAKSASGVESVLLENKYSLVYGSLARSGSRMLEFIRNAREMRLDGVIITPDSWSDELLELIARSGIPTIALRRRPPASSGIPYVDADYYAGSEIMVDHLFRSGHRKIGHIVLNTSIGLERKRGYEDAMRTRGLEPFCVTVDLPANREIDGEKNGYAAMKRMLEQYPEVTAVYASSDPMAIGAMEYLMEREIRVPESISVCGTGDNDLSCLGWFQLTTVAFDRYELGRRTAQMLLKMISGEVKNPDPVLLETHLIVRGSVKSIKKL